MVLSKEDFMKRLQERIGDDTTEDALSFIEDFTDTLNDLVTRSTSDGENEWKTKYEELDKNWREKYKARFFDSKIEPEEVKKEQKEDVEKDGEDTSFEDLFEEREGK